MLSPRRVKFRKQQRGRMRGVATRGNTIAFGEFALQAQECGWITSRQIEASRRAMTRRILFEMGGDEITPEIAKEAMRLAQYKLPLKTKFLTLADQETAAPVEA